MSRACRVIIDPFPGTGAWNMAVDEVLLDSAVTADSCTVRWYRWSEATLSLGYFQHWDPADVPLAWRQLPVVRRLSGGGAILHHHELTYSCSVPAGHPQAADPRLLYSSVHSRIIDVLAEFKIAVALRGTANASVAGEFLCFGRGDAFDVVAHGTKILGSAQRRRKGAILQHGSLLLRRSEFVPQFPGIFDFARDPLDYAVLIERLAVATGGLFAEDPQRGTLLPDEQRFVSSRISASGLSV